MSDEKNTNDINKVFGEIKEVLVNLNKKIEDQNEKISNLENRILFSEKNKNNGSVIGNYSPPIPPSSENELDNYKKELASEIFKAEKTDKYEEKENVDENIDEFSNTSEPPIPEPPSPSILNINKEEGSLEERIGGKWFAKIGIVVLVLGVSFFLKYAFDNDWIGETGRIIIGILIGLSLLGWGEKTIRKYFLYGQIVSGGGIAVLYLSIFAALNFYHLITFIPAFMFMGMVTAVGILLSLRYKAPSLIVFSLIGGFATPFLVDNGGNIKLILFSYLILLDLSVLAISVFQKWRWLNLIGFFGTLIVFSSWYDHFYTDAQLFYVFIFLTIFFIIYSIASVIYNLVQKQNSTGTEQVMTILTGFIYFAISYNLLNPEYHSYLGFFALILAFYYFIEAYLIRELTPEDDNLYNFLALYSVGFITLAIPIQFKGYLITMFWIVEAVLLVLLGITIKGDKGLVVRFLAFAVFMLGIFRVLAIDGDSYKMSDLLFINKVFVSSLIAVGGAYLIALLYYKNKTIIEKEGSNNKVFGLNLMNVSRIISVMIVLAGILTIFSVSRDLNIYHRNQIDLEYKIVNENNQQIRNQYGNVHEYFKNVDNEKIKLIKERGAASISLFWLVYGLIIITVGVLKKYNPLLALGIVLNLIVVFKLFFYELWNFDSFFRVIIAFATIIFLYLSSILFYEYSKEPGAKESFIQPKKIFIAFILIANILTIFAVSREIFLYFDKQIDTLKKETTQVCSKSNVFDKFSSYSKNSSYDSPQCEEMRDKVKKLENKASISISLFWLFYAIILVVLGFARKYKWVRVGGVTLLMIAILKLFFVDLWSLGQLYRIIASISLGLVLLGISYLYQKNKDLFKEIINN